MHTMLIIENSNEEDVIIVETCDYIWTEVTDKTLPDVVFADESERVEHPQWENGYTWSFRYAPAQFD